MKLFKEGKTISLVLNNRLEQLPSASNLYVYSKLHIWGGKFPINIYMNGFQQKV